MFDKKNGFSPKAIISLFVFGFLGLAVCALIDFFKRNNAQTPVLYDFLVFFFAGIWIFTLMVIVPVQTLYFRRKNRDDSSLEKAKLSDIAGIVTGTFNPDAKLPKWISIPVFGLLWLLISIAVLVIAMVPICLCIDVITGK